MDARSGAGVHPRRTLFVIKNQEAQKMAKIKETARVISQEKLADGVYSMWIDSPAIASQAVPGQFISL